MGIPREAWRETATEMPQVAKPHLDGQIGALALRQHGVIALEQLVALGPQPRSVRWRAEIGRLHRVHRTVYSLVPPELLSREGRYMAATLACGPGAVVSHRAAANLHGLRHDLLAKVDVTVPGSSHRRHAGVRLHRSLTLAPADTTTVNGIPCTTVARTFLDLAEVLDRRSLERTLDQAEILHLFDLYAILEQIERHPSRRGVKRLRAALETYLHGGAPTRSEFEEAFLRLVRRAQLPLPEVNVWVVLDDGEEAIKADFMWRAERLMVETDGFDTHRTRRAFESDRRRDQRLAVAGWRVIRITWLQLLHTPGKVFETLLALLRPAAAPG